MYEFASSHCNDFKDLRDDDEIIEIINSTVGKLQQIEDKYYYSLDLNYYLNNLEDDAYEA